MRLAAAQAQPGFHEYTHTPVPAAEGYPLFQDEHLPVPNLPPTQPQVFPSEPQHVPVQLQEQPDSQNQCSRARRDLTPPVGGGSDIVETALYPVTIIFLSVPDEALRPASGRGSKSAPKKVPSTKMEYLGISGSRSDFISSTLAVHQLADEFRAGEHSGPHFKMWWTGVTKSSASSIDNDRDFRTAVKAILQKNRKMCQIFVEYDVDQMAGFRIRRNIALDRNEQLNDELLQGTQVPRVDHFDDSTKLHGQFILQLKQRWPCDKHLGENGGVGYCYVSPNQDHVGLNNRKLALWAAAIAAAETTKHLPPNILEFDGCRDGASTAGKARGRVGPRPTGSSDDITKAMIAAVIPYIARTPKRSRRRSPSSSPPARASKRRNRVASPTPSPLPPAGSELHACLTAFASEKGIDFLDVESALQMLDFTPDIIPEVSTDLLRDITGAVEGKVLKLKLFAREWNAKVDAKKRRSKV